MEAAGRCGGHVAVVEHRPGVWWTLLFGVPLAIDVDAMVAAWEPALQSGVPYRSLVDASRISHVDADGFARLVVHLKTKREAYLRLLERQAIVRPEGLVGAVSAGLLELAGFRAPVSVFTNTSEALAWLDPDGEDLSIAYAGWVDRMIGLPEPLRRLREFLETNLQRATLDSTARALATSQRTLQRDLLASGTSFQKELDRTRIDRASRMLATTDMKVSAIASAVGYQATARFNELFLRATGMQPLDFRARARSSE